MRTIYQFTCFWLILSLAIPFLRSCGRQNGSQSEIPLPEAGKPRIDSSKVLATIDLYRASRYEGLREAFDAGPENVHKLILYGRHMGALPPEIGRLTYLASLDVAYNELGELPQELSGLHYLQGFYANGNNLTKFPGQLLLLPVLAKIDLSDNQIREIPPEIGIMDQLTYLSLDKNVLTDLPPQLYTLPNLRVLELSGNGLSRISGNISDLNSLKKLDLSDNQFTSLPKEITALSGTLNELEIQGNRIPGDEIEWLMEAMPETRIRY